MKSSHNLGAEGKLYSASIHPEESCFVTGGEDFKLYKYSSEDSSEIGRYYEDTMFIQYRWIFYCWQKR